MNDRSVTTQDHARFLPVMLLLFVGSGCAALIYEVVWFQLLQLVIGSSAVSLGVLLGTFMGGMCLGSFLLPRYIDARAPSAAGLRVSSSSASALMGLLLLFGHAARQRHLHGASAAATSSCARSSRRSACCRRRS